MTFSPLLLHPDAKKPKHNLDTIFAGTLALKAYRNQRVKVLEYLLSDNESIYGEQIRGSGSTPLSHTWYSRPPLSVCAMQNPPRFQIN